MKKYLKQFALAFIMVFIFSGIPANAIVNNQKKTVSLQQAKVTRHVDGDTVEVQMNKKKYKVRMIGVNTPETKHPNKGVEYYGKEASQYTKDKLLNKIVYLQSDVQDKDKYGRLLRYVWTQKPNDVNSEKEIRTKMFNANLLLNGYGQVMTIQPNSKYAKTFVKFQQEAIKNKKGLWKSGKVKPNTNKPNVKNTNDKNKVVQTKGKIIGTISSKKFHKLNCRWAKKINPKNSMYFNTREEAIKKGYSPCKVCNP